LLAQERLRHGAEGAIVEEHEQRADAMLVRDGKEPVDAILELVPDVVAALRSEDKPSCNPRHQRGMQRP